jgi:hypothetical protein
MRLLPPIPPAAPDIQYWCVAFPAQTFGAPPPWYLRRLDARWRHCLALRMVGPDATLIAEHVGSYTRMEIQPRKLGDAIRELQEVNAALILLVEEQLPEARAMMRGPLSCVEFVKALLGIRRPWIVTPRQLYRHLRRLGASHVFPTTA